MVEAESVLAAVAEAAEVEDMAVALAAEVARMVAEAVSISKVAEVLVGAMENGEGIVEGFEWLRKEVKKMKAGTIGQQV